MTTSASANFATFPSCPYCNAPGPHGRFCRPCGKFFLDGSGAVERVTFNRRFFGVSLLEGILIVFTLGVGWLIWLAFTAQTAQTPAKRLLNVYIVDADSGRPVTAGRVWIRELLVKALLFSLLNLIAGVASLVDDLWILFDKDRQALHDKIASTVVVYAPYGLPSQLQSAAGAGVPIRSGTVVEAATQLRELARLREEGILTEEEYEAKRSAIAQRM